MINKISNEILLIFFDHLVAINLCKYFLLVLSKLVFITIYNETVIYAVLNDQMF